MNRIQKRELSELQSRLKISDGQLIDFAQQFAVADCSHCSTGKDALVMDRFTDTHIEMVLEQLRLLWSLECPVVPNGGKIDYAFDSQILTL